MYSTIVDPHGVCLQFVFRLTGQQTELSVIIDRKGINGELLWKFATYNRSSHWAEAQVWLGIVSQFRVSF